MIARPGKPSSLTTQEQKGVLVRRTRDLAGVASVIGFVFLVGYAFTNLRPGWQWTVEDTQFPADGQTDES